MWLTTENVEQYMGCTLDKNRFALGAYPYKVGRWPDGEPYVMDRTGTCMKIAKPGDYINLVWFNIVDGKEITEV